LAEDSRKQSEKQKSKPGRKRMDTDVFVAEHPQATMAQIAVRLSRSGAIRRMQDVCAKGLTANSGTYRHPFWEVPGVEHSPEELLTERQTCVLACLRRDPAPSTAQIAAELECAASTVNNEYRALEARALAHRAARGRWAAVGGAGDVEPAYGDALSYVREHSGRRSRVPRRPWVSRGTLRGGTCRGLRCGGWWPRARMAGGERRSFDCERRPDCLGLDSDHSL
jgi:hypothetical protein